MNVLTEVAHKELLRRLNEHEVMRTCMPHIFDLLGCISRGEPGDHTATARALITEYNRKCLDAGLVESRYGP